MATYYSIQRQAATTTPPGFSDESTGTFRPFEAEYLLSAGEVLVTGDVLDMVTIPLGYTIFAPSIEYDVIASAVTAASMTVGIAGATNSLFTTITITANTAGKVWSPSGTATAGWVSTAGARNIIITMGTITTVTWIPGTRIRLSGFMIKSAR